MMEAQVYPSAVDMPSAATELQRANALREYGILDTGAEQAFDDLTALASQICKAPASIITFIDGNRLWFKSTYGLTATEAPVEHSFCAHAAGEPNEVFAIEDALSDGRFLQNVFVMPEDGLRAYAGANIVDPTGVPLGSICVVDFKERPFTEEQRQALNRLSRQVVDQLQLRKRVVELDRERSVLRRSNEHLERITHVLAHDLRAPLLNQEQLVSIIQEDHGGELSEEISYLLGQVANGATRGLQTVSDIMEYLRGSRANQSAKERILVASLFERLRDQHLDSESVDVRFVRDGVKSLYSERVGLERILVNLINNAIKYIGRDDGRVTIKAWRDGSLVRICVSDNGPGIPESERKSVFELFKRGSSAAGSDGTGVGLAMAQRLAASLGGDISLHEAEEGGCRFSLALPA